MHKLDAQYSEALLYMATSEGGLGCVKLCNLVHMRKLFRSTVVLCFAKNR